MKIKTNATWTVKGLIPYIPVGRNGERPVAKYFITDELPATVPGGVHMDLFNAGVIENPYYETNTYAVLADDAYFTLLPNEEKTISLTIGKRQGLFFDVPDNKFDIKFNCLNK